MFCAEMSLLHVTARSFLPPKKHKARTGSDLVRVNPIEAFINIPHIVPDTDDMLVFLSFFLLVFMFLIPPAILQSIPRVGLGDMAKIFYSDTGNLISR